MPRSSHYDRLILAEAIRKVAERHNVSRTRHLSEEEDELLLWVPDVVEPSSPHHLVVVA